MMNPGKTSDAAPGCPPADNHARMPASRSDSEPVSVLIIDENPSFLRIIDTLLQDYYQGEIIVAGTSSGGESALSMAGLLKPQVILLGVSQYNIAGLQLIPDLRAALPAVGIIVMEALDIPGYRSAAKDAGADVVLSKTDLNRALLPAIREVMQRSTASYAQVIGSDPCTLL